MYVVAIFWCIFRDVFVFSGVVSSFFINFRASLMTAAVPASLI